MMVRKFHCDSSGWGTKEIKPGLVDVTSDFNRLVGNEILFENDLVIKQICY